MIRTATGLPPNTRLPFVRFLSGYDGSPDETRQPAGTRVHLSPMLVIAGKAAGARKPLFAEFSVPPPQAVDDSGDGGGPLTLRDVIAHVVRQEVEAFEKRQEARRLDRVLSPA